MVGRVIHGRYTLGRELGRGAMATVYAARDSVDGRDVAVKVIHPHVAAEDRVRQRLGREVSVASKIPHPNVVQIFDSGVEPSDGSFFIVMELLRGETLLERLRRGDVDARAAMDLVCALLDPLATAHASGVVHRDLKPANVFLTPLEDGSERVTLLDFGIARDLDAGSLTRTESMLGTPQYMAPEQAMDAKRASPAADVWAVGVLLYFALCRAHPFVGESAYDVVIRACTQPHAPLSSRVRGLDARLEALVDRCLSKDPAGRPTDARALRGELQALLALDDVQRSLEHLEVLPSPPTPAEVTSSTADVPGPPIPSARATPPVPATSHTPSKTYVDAAPPSRGRVALVAVSLGIATISAALWIVPRAPTPEAAPVDAGPSPASAESAAARDPITTGARTRSSSMAVTNSDVVRGPDASAAFAPIADARDAGSRDEGPREREALRDARARRTEPTVRSDAAIPRVAEPSLDAAAETTSAGTDETRAAVVSRDAPREVTSAEPPPEDVELDASVPPEVRAVPVDAGLPRGPTERPAERPVEAAPPAKKKPKPFLTF
ncbi:protein kinase [Myxococcota bacterium]|nr:protein kinase [Myxococcota bacterium]